MAFRLGVDVGGTFTDLFLVGDNGAGTQYRVKTASGVCWARGQISWPMSPKRFTNAGSANASITAAWSLATISFGVPLGTHSPCQNDE